MLLTAQIRAGGDIGEVLWDHLEVGHYFLNPGIHYPFELVSLQTDLQSPALALPWDLRVTIPPGSRLVLSEGTTSQPIQVDGQRELVFNQGEGSEVLTLRGNYQYGTHYIVPVPSSPNLIVTARSSPESPFQDAFSVGLQPDPGTPPPTLWDHLEDS